MTLLELLDQIDGTAPRTCETCIYASTHAKCHGREGHPDCLCDPEDYAAKPRPAYRYRHWTPGNWLREEHRAQLAGEKNIVIGGSGEAEIDATKTPQETAKHLHYVAGQCGYSFGPLTKVGDETHIQGFVSSGVFMIVWKGGQLERIEPFEDDRKGIWRWNRSAPWEGA